MIILIISIDQQFPVYTVFFRRKIFLQLVKTRSCRQLWHVKRAILSKILSICLSLQFGISYSSKCCLKKSKTDFIWYDILSVYTGCCHASSSQMQIINQYWAIPEKNTNRGGGEGGLRIWNFLGYQRNSMWNFQELIKNELEFPLEIPIHFEFPRVN